MIVRMSARQSNLAIKGFLAAVTTMAFLSFGCGNKGMAVAPAPAVAAVPEKPAEPEWRNLFDGKTLNGWKRTEFGGEGEPKVKDGNLLIPMGATLSGVNYTEPTPKMNYEVSLEAMRVDGSDFFCGLTVPIGDSSASLILGGWGGGLCGISSLDGQDAANNETSTVRSFQEKKWYSVRLRITSDRIEAWIGEKKATDKPGEMHEEKIVDVSTKERKISTRAESDPSRPFGLMTYTTTGAFRNIRLREL